MALWLHAAIFFCCALAYEAGMPEDEWPCGCMLKDFFPDALHAGRRGGTAAPLSAPFGYPKIFIRGNSIIFAYVESF